ncbi:MAG: alpha/beta fold hydrolase [Acidobacteriota bacterium]
MSILIRAQYGFAAGMCWIGIPHLVAAQNRAESPGTALRGCPAQFNVGFQVVTLQGGSKAALWYPTEQQEHPYNYSAAIQGSVARDSAISRCQRFPLVVFSHGLGGCGTQSVFITEELARGGYVVAAPDHKDATCHADGTGTFAFRASQRSFFKPETWTSSTYADRRRDMEEAIDRVLNSREFSASVDPNRIGLAGHSVGGYVALGMAGAWTTWKDPRIQAVLLFSPYVLPFLARNLLQGIDIPVMYQGAQFDFGITPFLQGKSGAYAVSHTQKFYVELKGGNHFEWTNLLCADSKTVANCVRSKPNARLILSYSTMFFDRFLKNTSNVTPDLSGSGLAAYQHN